LKLKIRWIWLFKYW